MSLGGGPKCGKCVKSVYFNEKVDACGMAWHKRCFQCFDCGKSLDSGSVADKREGGKLLVKRFEDCAVIIGVTVLSLWLLLFNFRIE